MALLLNKEVDSKGHIGMYIAVRLLVQKMYESRNQPDQSPLRSIELPLRSPSIQVRVPSKGEEQSQSIQVCIPSKGEERGQSIQVRKPSKGKERSHADQGSRTCPKTEWIINIHNKIKQASHDDAARSWNKLCIYRVPQRLLDDRDSNAYIPKIVSLGPYHHGNERLRDMDRHKWRALHHILNRTGQRIEIYLDAVKELEEEARSYYEGTISLSSDEFVEMMVLDSCFMLELFRGVVRGLPPSGYFSGDPIFANLGSIYRDMILLENQIPVFILDKMLSLQNGKEDQTGVAIWLAYGFLNQFTQVKQKDTFLVDVRGAQHFLDLSRRTLVIESQSVRDTRPQRFMHCVTELKEAGIRFVRRETDIFWDIKFENGVLQIPCVKIQDGTKSLFLNLIAYEQCKLRDADCAGEITAYAIFMDGLINTAADVRYLHHKGIIEHWLGNDDDVAELFNDLCKEVVSDLSNNYLSKVTGDLNDHYERKLNIWKASLRHNYFHSPWSTISFCAAALLLVLTFLQTVFTVYPYFQKSSGDKN